MGQVGLISYPDSGPIGRLKDLFALIAGSVNSALQAAILPAGSIVQFGGPVAPAGFALCDGSSLSTTTEASLFAVIGYTYGGSGGSFNVPNCKGRVAVGLDATQTEFNVLSKNGGEKTHTLTTAEMPSHTHPLVGSHGGSGIGPSVTGNSNNDQGYALPGGLATSTGGGTAHQNMPPYITLNSIIKK